MEKNGADDLLRAGELARRTGVSKDALRFYERSGLLAPPHRLANGYRAYPADAVERVLWIRRVLAAGFTVAELARLLAVRGAGGAPCREARAIGAAKLAAVEERLSELAAARDALRELLDDWDRRLAAAAPGEPARLLEALRQPAARREPTVDKKTTRRGSIP
jgi:DNA-binding transcriptional MerR regulator